MPPRRKLRAETIKRQALDRLKERVMQLYRQACAYEGVDYSKVFYAPFKGEFSPDNPYIAAYREALAQWKEAEQR